MALTDLLIRGSSVAVVVFVVSSTLGVGLSLAVGQILAPLKNARLVVLSLAANFVLAPLVALGLWRVLGLDEPLGIGLLLCGLAAGAPFLIKLAEFAKADLAFAVGLMVLLMVVTVGYLPVALPLFLEGITVNPVKIARSLVVLMLLPLAVGLLIRARRPGASDRIRPTVGWISNISMILVVALTTAGHFKSVLSGIRHLRRPGRRRVHGGLRRYRVAPWRTRKEHPGGAGSGDGAEKCRRCIRGRRAELRRREGHRDDHRRLDCRVPDAAAVRSHAREGPLECGPSGGSMPSGKRVVPARPCRCEGLTVSRDRRHTKVSKLRFGDGTAI